jgi:hypothetical protein
VGDTSIDIDGFTGSEVLAEDTEFVIAATRGLYRITEKLTLSSGEGTMKFWPPLLEAVADGDVMTVTTSTLTRKLERIAVGLTAARAAISKGALLLQQSNDAITQTDLANPEVDIAKTTLAAGNSLLNTVTIGGPNALADYARQAQTEIGTGQGYSNIGQTYLLIAERAREFSRWGYDKANQLLVQLQRGLAPRQYRRYPRD